MTTIQTSMPGAGKVIPRSSAWDRLRINRNWLALWFMLPAAAFLLLFLAYPLFLGVCRSSSWANRKHRSVAAVAVAN